MGKMKFKFMDPDEFNLDRIEADFTTLSVDFMPPGWRSRSQVYQYARGRITECRGRYTKLGKPMLACMLLLERDAATSRTTTFFPIHGTDHKGRVFVSRLFTLLVAAGLDTYDALRLVDGHWRPTLGELVRDHLLRREIEVSGLVEAYHDREMFQAYGFWRIGSSR